MEDRELLERAAKAAGWKGWRSKHGYWNLESPDGVAHTCCTGWASYDASTGEKLPEPTFDDALAEAGWNPLIDGADALWLSVKLRIDVVQFSTCVRANAPESEDWHEAHGSDPYAATRRAIVGAAALLPADG